MTGIAVGAWAGASVRRLSLCVGTITATTVTGSGQSQAIRAAACE